MRYKKGDKFKSVYKNEILTIVRVDEKKKKYMTMNEKGQGDVISEAWLDMFIESRNYIIIDKIDEFDYYSDEIPYK